MDEWRNGGMAERGNRGTGNGARVTPHPEERSDEGHEPLPPESPPSQQRKTFRTPIPEDKMSRRLFWSLGLAAASVGFAVACDDASGSSAATAVSHEEHVNGDQVVFQPGPASFPAGSQIAVLQGNPAGNGEFTVRLKWPAGYRLPPHFHPTDENVTVLSGTFLVGLGDEINLDKALKLGPKGFITARALGHHFAVAKTDVLVQVHGLGPFAITYVNPADDPRK